MKNKYSKRVFLNPETHKTAYIVAIVPEIEKIVYKKENKTHISYEFYPTLEIKDCLRSVNLDFNVYYDTETKETRKIGLQKIKETKAKLLLFQEIVNNFVEKSLAQIEIIDVTTNKR